MVVLTEDLLLMGMEKNVGLNRDQAEMIGIDYPLISGWKDRAIGMAIHPKSFGMFLLLKGKKPAHRKQIIRQYLNAN